MPNKLVYYVRIYYTQDQTSFVVTAAAAAATATSTETQGVAV